MSLPASERPLVIWRFVDGKPGHEKQSLGLVNALGRLHRIDAYTIDVRHLNDRFAPSLWNFLTCRFDPGRHLPHPDLLIGAGHATHLAMLAAKRAYGGKCIVLMKPSLPLGLFDLCVIPEHDHPPSRENVMRIRGVLNNVQSSSLRSSQQGLILIGGVSSHYAWNDETVAAAVSTIATTTPSITWQLTTSRRTPETFTSALQQPLPSNLRLVPHKETAPGWLEHALAEASQVWVTEDSVSMLYEALTTGVGVGLLQLESQRSSRVQRGVEQLITDNAITTFNNWHHGSILPVPKTAFNESERVAAHILGRDLNHASI